MDYQLIKEIDLLNNQKLVIWLNVYSLLIFLGLIIVGALVFPIAYFSFNFIPLVYFVSYFYLH
ncbi:hypothetical protein [Paraliobacillus ryukyuensis]|uniref:hypothetical protein n=1 Tax=Paraliobacillus ryukyuensis TaxID=200904 RepID=UPI0021186DD1|nr:hypothetical protein [Paraliobacillus ryukyuensis]